jgi:hypothetical protein
MVSADRSVNRDASARDRQTGIVAGRICGDWSIHLVESVATAVATEATTLHRGTVGSITISIGSTLFILHRHVSSSQFISFIISSSPLFINMEIMGSDVVVLLSGLYINGYIVQDPVFDDIAAADDILHFQKALRVATE